MRLSLPSGFFPAAAPVHRQALDRRIPPNPFNSKAGPASLPNGRAKPATPGRTKEEIHSLFTAAGYDKSPSVTFIDAVVIPDLAYGRVGAVLFTDDETRTVKVMFLDADGNGQTAGPCAKPCAESELTYCGDGTVSFKLETEEGTAYTYWLSLAIDGSHVKFSARDNLDDVVK